MDPRQMRKRCPSAIFICLDSIKNQVLEFSKTSIDGTGKATIRKKKNSIVYGAVYSVNKQDIEVLDEFEGIDTHYHRKIKYTDSGYRCAVYIACSDKIDKKLAPSIEYKNKITFGLISIGAPSDYYFTIKRIQAVKPKLKSCRKNKNSI